MASPKTVSEATCDICGTLFKERRRRWHCDHCHKYYYVCPACVVRHLKCPHCGIVLKKRGEPLNKRGL